jgi:ADP-ribose pyrophosphatase
VAADVTPTPPGERARGDDHLVEVPVRAETVFEGRFLQVRRDIVRLPDGHETHREFIVHPGAVAVVPLLDDGRLVMVRQYRYPLQRVLLEFPAGKLDPGEGAFATGVRELAEETGYTAREWARAGALHNAAAYSDEVIEIWFARGLQAGAQRLDHGEFIEVVPMGADELDALAARGELTDAKTLIGLLWLQRWRAGAWPLQWRPAPVSVKVS